MKAAILLVIATMVSAKMPSCAPTETDGGGLNTGNEILSETPQIYYNIARVLQNNNNFGTYYRSSNDYIPEKVHIDAFYNAISGDLIMPPSFKTKEDGSAPKLKEVLKIGYPYLDVYSYEGLVKELIRVDSDFKTEALKYGYIENNDGSIWGINWQKTLVNEFFAGLSRHRENTTLSQGEGFSTPNNYHRTRYLKIMIVESHQISSESPSEYQWYGLSKPEATMAWENAEYIFINAEMSHQAAQGRDFTNLIDNAQTCVGYQPSIRMDYYFFFASTELHELGHLLMKKGDAYHHKDSSVCCIMTSIVDKGNGKYSTDKMCNDISCSNSKECRHQRWMRDGLLWDEPTLGGTD